MIHKRYITKGNNSGKNDKIRRQKNPTRRASACGDHPLMRDRRNATSAGRYFRMRNGSNSETASFPTSLRLMERHFLNGPGRNKCLTWCGDREFPGVVHHEARRIIEELPSAQRLLAAPAQRDHACRKGSRARGEFDPIFLRRREQRVHPLRGGSAPAMNRERCRLIGNDN
jgi:hypothetical protein